MFSKLIKAFSSSSNKAVDLPASTASTTAHESTSAHDEVYQAAIYRINGTAIELVRPFSKLVFSDDSLDTLNEHEQVDVSMAYLRICAIRQHRPNTIQFLYRGPNGYDCDEYGYHFKEAFAAFTFRAALLEGMSVTTDPILGVKVSVALFDSKTKEFLPWLQAASPMVLSRRKEDGMSLLTVYGLDETTIMFQTELTRDVQFFPTVAERQFTLWGPFVNRGTERHPEMVRSLLLFKLADENQHDFEEVFLILDKLVGYEAKIVEAQENVAEYDNDALKGDDNGNDNEEIMWDSTSSDERGDDDSCRGDDCDYRHDSDNDLGRDLSDADDSPPVMTGRRRKRQSVIESVDPSSLIIEKDPDAKLHRFMQCGEGRSFVCRSTGNTTDPLYWKDPSRSSFDVQVYGKDDAKLAYKGSIDGSKFVYKNKAVAANTGLLHKGERHLLVCDPGDKTGVYSMDLEREKIVSRIDTNELGADMIFSTFKGGQASDDPTFMAANDRAFYLMDTRQGGSRQHALTYATNTQFTAACTDEKGHVLLGNKFGQLRLYDGEPNDAGKFKIAKTQLNASENECIKAVDVTPDGSWILATMKTCLVVYPTKLKSTGKTGFETRLGKYKPPGVFLRLKIEDIMKYDLQDIDFQPAIFDQANQSILTSTGNLAIVWDFKAVKQGKLYNYSIKITDQYIKDSRALNDGSVVVAYPQAIDVLGQKKGIRSSS